MKLYFSILFVFITGLAISSSSQDKSQIAKSSSEPALITLQPCEVPGASERTKEKVSCGTYEVFENRATKTGRRITLKIVVFPATGEDKLPDPVFYIPGGPGSSAIEDAPYVAQDLAKIREQRDLVFLDQRGTGGSNPLNCEFFNPSDLQSYLGHWNPPEQVRKCRAQLETKADLRLYVTSIAMDDLDDVRAALGYRQINIVAGSYGTRAAQTYLKQHGEHVRTAVLQGVSPTDQSMPRDFPQHTQRALNGVLAECAADAACHAAFPDLGVEVKTVLEKLISGPIEVEVKVPPNSEKITSVKLSRDLAGEAVRYMLYSSGGASRIPLFLHLAATGNFTPLGESAIYFRQQIVATGATGMYLSVTCAEDLPWIKPGEGNGDNTFLGDYRLRQQREDCALWPRGEIPKDYMAPIRSNVPVLITTGQWDPVTPPLYGDRLAKSLPNSRHIIVPSGGHGFGGLEGLDCISKLTLDFITTSNAKGLDISCVKGIHRNNFLLKLTDR
jgi:pimeloyl-ACP methyl ester carboxylesterase